MRTPFRLPTSSLSLCSCRCCRSFSHLFLTGSSGAAVAIYVFLSRRREWKKQQERPITFPDHCIRERERERDTHAAPRLPGKPVAAASSLCSSCRVRLVSVPCIPPPKTLGRGIHSRRHACRQTPCESRRRLLGISSPPVDSSKHATPCHSSRSLLMLPHVAAPLLLLWLPSSLCRVACHIE